MLKIYIKTKNHLLTDYEISGSTERLHRNFATGSSTGDDCGAGVEG